MIKLFNKWTEIIFISFMAVAFVFFVIVVVASLMPFYVCSAVYEKIEERYLFK